MISPEFYVSDREHKQKDEMGVKQGLREVVCVCVCVLAGVGGGVSLKWGSHMCDTSPEEAGLNPRGWWNLFIEPNKADEKAIYGIMFHLHFVQPPDQKTILIWGLHQ